MTHSDAGLLIRIAEETMRDRGFIEPPPADAIAEANRAKPLDPAPAGVRDLRSLAWTSIDNPDSGDLDQIEVIEQTAAGMVLRVGIADVDAYVPAGSAIDRFAANNTTSVYTGVRNFPMLPPQLSYGLTSLLPDQPRLAIVIDTPIGADGKLGDTTLSLALVENHAKLDYPSVSAWLDGKTPPPGRLATDAALRDQVIAQDKLAKTLYATRKAEGALDVDTAEMRAVTDPAGNVVEIVPQVEDRAGKIIEELMIASNRGVARALDRAGFPSLRRVVKRPERWPKIIAFAASRGVKLPDEPDSRALSAFADRMRREQPDDFPVISVTLVKLIGRGEYVSHAVGEAELGHFGLAATAYTHSTAPNRRYPDLVIQRLIKALAAGRPTPITIDQLATIATRCTEQGAAADKVARRVHKSAAASMLASRVGERFPNAVVTGVTDNGTFVRVSSPSVEGKLVHGDHGREVGDKLNVRLVDVNVERGFIDFAPM